VIPTERGNLVKEKVVNKFLVNALIIILATAITILVHVVMPAGVNEEDLDGALVQLFGFPLISVFYFILLFTHCAVVVQYFGKKANMQRLQIGSRFGLAFALIYLFGMQEVSVETSPFAEWGSAFVNYQFFMGVGDAIPVLLLCITIAYFLLNNTNITSSVKTLSSAEKVKVVALIAAAFLIERFIGYETGVLVSSCHTYPVPCYLWTMLFGVVLGCCYVILYPLFARESNKLSISVNLAVLTIGANWMIFNSFIGLIFSGYILQTLLRSGIDMAVLFLISIVVGKYLLKTIKA
jgi:hypothetical protein